MLIFLSLSFALIALIALFELRRPACTAPAERLYNLFALGCHSAVQLSVLPLIALTPMVRDHALVDLSAWPFLLALLGFTLLMDFGEFAYHRVQHAVPFLWRMHALHHSDPNMNASTAVRHFWGDQLLKAVTIWPACVFLLKPTAGVMIGYSLLSCYHFFVHANLKVSFGRWSWLLNSPAYHRRHHSASPEHWNCNYASLFPVYDMLLGSYRRPDGFPDTGLPERPAGFADIILWPLKAR